MGSSRYKSTGMCCKAVFRYEFEESREFIRNFIHSFVTVYRFDLMTLRTLVRPTYTLPKYLNFSQNCGFWHLQHFKNCI
jgi:hypothetical protein